MISGWPGRIAYPLVVTSVVGGLYVHAANRRAASELDREIYFPPLPVAAAIAAEGPAAAPTSAPSARPFGGVASVDE